MSARSVGGKDRADDREAPRKTSMRKAVDIARTQQAVQARDHASRDEERDTSPLSERRNRSASVPTTRPRRQEKLFEPSKCGRPNPKIGIGDGMMWEGGMTNDWPSEPEINAAIYRPDTSRSSRTAFGFPRSGVPGRGCGYMPSCAANCNAPASLGGS